MNASASELRAPKLITLSFLIAIVIGAACLKLPASARTEPLSWIDALFMSTSATCVTGLSVVDVGGGLTFFGQTVLLVLIQAGGLGIMTFSVFFMMLLRMKTTLTSRISLGLSPHRSEMQNLLQTLLFVILMTAFVEAAGAALLYLHFRALHPPEMAVFSSVFHAVSAFCNAGFGLYSDSLMRFQTDPLVCVTVMTLIVLGGLGFMTLAEVRAWVGAALARRKFRLSLHTRVTLLGTVVLILTGAGIVWLLERGNQFAPLSLPHQWLNAFFLSVTSRTAGFNTVSTGSLTDASLFFVILLMFIGGSSGSTAGGVKITTFAVILALIVAHVKGQPSTSLFKSKISRPAVGRALAIFAAALFSIGAAAFLLQITEKAGIRHDAGGWDFLDYLFEATSAFGTVGLSTGVTPELTAGGKIIAILLMFAGRVGPLTLGLALMARKRTEPKYEYPEEDVVLG